MLYRNRLLSAAFAFAAAGTLVACGQAPAGAEENNAIDLNKGSASEEVVNISEGSVLVRKNWKKADGSDIPDSELMDKSITVTLKRKTGTGQEAVVDPDFADQKHANNCWQKP